MLTRATGSKSKTLIASFGDLISLSMVNGAHINGSGSRTPGSGLSANAGRVPANSGLADRDFRNWRRLVARSTSMAILPDNSACGKDRPTQDAVRGGRRETQKNGPHQVRAARIRKPNVLLRLFLLLVARRPRCHRRGRILAHRRTRRRVRLELGRGFELILAHREAELVIARVPARAQLERRRVDRDLLRADAEDAADADHVGQDLAVLREQDIAAVADLLLIGADHVDAAEFRGEP